MEIAIAPLRLVVTLRPEQTQMEEDWLITVQIFVKKKHGKNNFF